MKKMLLIAAGILCLAALTACLESQSDICPPQNIVSPAEDTPLTPLEPAPPPSELPPDGGGFLEDIEEQVVELINEERLDLGLTELELDPLLQEAAKIRSKELCQDETSQNQKLAHLRPDGTGWETVLIQDVPVPGLVEAGEILAREKTTSGCNADQDPIPAKDWFLLWKSSKPHYETITWAEAQKVGVGIYYEIRDGEYYTNATVLFGRFLPQ